MTYRDDEAARAARLAALERAAAEADDLRARLRAAEDRNRALEARLAALAPADPPAPAPAPDEPPPSPRPPPDLGDPRLAAALAAAEYVAAVELYREHVEHAPDVAHRRAALVAMAVLLEHELGDPGGAIDALRDALDLDPTDAFVAAALTALLARAERWVDLVDLLDSLATHEHDPARRATHLVRRGQLLLHHLADPAAAADSFRAALDADPSSAAAAAGLRTAQR